jgi:hypothetical protein
MSPSPTSHDFPRWCPPSWLVPSHQPLSPRSPLSRWCPPSIYFIVGSMGLHKNRSAHVKNDESNTKSHSIGNGYQELLWIGDGWGVIGDNRWEAMAYGRGRRWWGQWWIGECLLLGLHSRSTLAARAGVEHVTVEWHRRGRFYKCPMPRPTPSWGGVAKLKRIKS